MKTNHLIFFNILNFVRIIYMYVSIKTDHRLPLSMFSVLQVNYPDGIPPILYTHTVYLILRNTC